jgi:V/A-type H+-transporting ATPase subunit I
MIEKLKKVNLLIIKDKKELVLETLFNLNLVHISSFREKTLRDFSYFKVPTPKKTYQEELVEIENIFSIFRQFGFENAGFFKSFFPNKIILSKSEFAVITKEFDLKKVYGIISGFLRNYEKLLEEENLLKEEVDYINIFKSFPFQYSILLDTKFTRSICFSIKSKKLIDFTSQEKDFLGNVFFYQFAADKDLAKIFMLYLPEDEDKINLLLKKYKIDLVSMPEHITGFEEEEVERINNRINAIDKEKNIIVSKIREIYVLKPKLLALKDFYKSLQLKESAVEKSLEGKEISVLNGFVRESEIDKIMKISDNDNCIVIISEPENDDVVPVSLKNNPIFKPFEFLVRMFGVPSYSNIDPVPVVAIIFTLFFGLALGDAFYGLILTIFAYLCLRKYRKDPIAHNFFSILLYGGVMSIIVGVLTGSVAGNFFQLYFPKSPIAKLITGIMIIDPLSPQGAVDFLVFAIGIGVFVQLLGTIMNIAAEIKNKNYLNAILNQVGWLLFLPGLVMLLLLSRFPFLRILDYSLIIIGLILLLVGGWNSVHKLMFKPVAALVNIYGIRSSYGVTSFFGDVLSYSRLFALGLSTSILASSFNLITRIISQMFGNVALLGLIPILVIWIATQSLGIVMSTLGAFIHSMRLNFLEFFGRFYNIGGFEFKPLGFEFKNIIIDSKEEVINNGKYGNS